MLVLLSVGSVPLMNLTLTTSCVQCQGFPGWQVHAAAAERPMQLHACSTGVSDGFWEYRLKPWDCAAGVLMVQEAGGIVTTMTGSPYTVFHRYIMFRQFNMSVGIASQLSL